jgi:hypothetical protein
MSSSQNFNFSAEAEIIKKLETSEKLINLAKEYGVGHATICNIRKNREKIGCFVKTIDAFFIKTQ